MRFGAYVAGTIPIPLSYLGLQPQIAAIIEKFNYLGQPGRLRTPYLSGVELIGSH